MIATKKALHRGWLSFLAHPSGGFIALLSVVWLLTLALQLLDNILVVEDVAAVVAPQWLPWVTTSSPSSVCRGDSTSRHRAPFPRSLMGDNVGGRSCVRDLCDEPIDAVYTWVNGSEPQHTWDVAYWQLKQRSEEGWDGNVAQQEGHRTPQQPLLSTQQLDDQSSRSRFEDHDELRFSLRSLVMYAGWVRHVYLVTTGQVPTWLNISHPKISVITHEQLFALGNVSSHLPTFSSPAIESHLHRIPGLSRRFLYLNDDTLFGAPVTPSDFYCKVKGHRLFYSWPVPQCSDGCPAAWLGDGTCDRQCNTSTCDYDSGDCIGPNVKVLGGGGAQATPPPVRGIPPQQSNQHCNGNCADGWIGDKYCDASCNHAACGYDAMDCGLQAYYSDKAFRAWTVTPTAREVEVLRQRLLLVTGSPSATNRTSPVSTNKTTNASTNASTAAGVTYGQEQRQQQQQRATTVTATLRRHYVLDVAAGSMAFLVNMSDAMMLGSSPEQAAKITTAHYVTPAWVRSATISQQHKLLVVSVVAEWLSRPQTCRFTVMGEREAGSPRTSAPTTETSAPIRLQIRLEFNVTVVNSSMGQHRSGDGENHVRLTKTVSASHTLPSKQQVLVIDDDLIRSESHAPSPVSSVDDRPTTAASNARKLFAAEAAVESDSLETTAAWSRLDPVGTAAAAVDDGGDLPSAQSSRTMSSQRRLFDLFGDSLKHSNMILTRKFRSTSRKVPAHMVHLIDRQVMDELWQEWPKEWEATSASRFRSRSNLQYAFMHYYWMVSATEHLTETDLFHRFIDVDRSGWMEPREARRVALFLWEKEVPEGVLDTVADNVVRSCLAALSDTNKTAPIRGRRNTDDSSESDQSHNDTHPTQQQPQQHQVHQLKGERRDAQVCEALLRHSSSQCRVARVRPQTVPPTPTLTKAADDAVVTSPPAQPTVTSSPIVHPSTTSVNAAIGRRRSNVTFRRQAGRSHTNTTRRHAPHTAAAPASTTPAPLTIPVMPPAPQVYRIPNPEDKIRPLPSSYATTVDWLLLAAVAGIRRPLTVDPPNASSTTASDDVVTAFSSRRLTVTPTNSVNGANRTAHYAEEEEERSNNTDDFLLNAQLFNGSHIALLLSEKYAVQPKYRVVLEDLNDVTFIMVRNNKTIVQNQMDHVMFKRPKFLCVNDDMNHSHPDFHAVLGSVQNMFQSYYPQPSPFERTDGTRNPITRLPTDYQNHQPLSADNDEPTVLCNTPSFTQWYDEWVEVFTDLATQSEANTNQPPKWRIKSAARLIGFLTLAVLCGKIIRAVQSATLSN